MARTQTTMQRLVSLLVFSALLGEIAARVASDDGSCRVVNEQLRKLGLSTDNQMRSDTPVAQRGRNEPVCLSKVNSCCPESTEAQMYSKTNADLAAHFKMVIEPQRDFIRLFMHSFKRKYWQ